MRHRLIPLTLFTCIALAACQSNSPGMSLEAAQQQLREQRDAEGRAVLAIENGQIANPISGTIEVPASVKAFAEQHSAGYPPMYLHVFQATGELVREAQASVFWKDDQKLAFAVDRVPPDVPLVLALTIEPGVVLRTVVPPVSLGKPARAQVISPSSEVVVEQLASLGVMPSVGAGGLSSVIAQGGLNPSAAAEANLAAANEYDQVAQSDWGKQNLPEMQELVAALRGLAQAQKDVAGQLAGQRYRLLGCVSLFGLNLYCWEDQVKKAQTKVKDKVVSSTVPPTILPNLSRGTQQRSTAIASDTSPPATVTNRSGSVIAAGGANVIAAGGGNVIAAGGGNVIAAGGANVINAGGGNVIAAGGGNVINAGGGNVIAAGGGNVINAGGGNVIAAGGANVINAGGGNLSGVLRFAEPPARTLMMEYQDALANSAAMQEMRGPNGLPFTAQEIAAALAKGTGPYRTDCRQVSLTPGDETCSVVVAPNGAQEVMVKRQSGLLQAQLEQMQKLWSAGKVKEVGKLFTQTPSLVNFFAPVPGKNNAGWTSPIGTWRMRIVQNDAPPILTRGILVNDAEATIAAPDKTAQDALASGPLSGTLSTWLANDFHGTDVLNSFVLAFEWNADAKALKQGRITGQQRFNGSLRELSNTKFEGVMKDVFRITGTWEADDKQASGRFELIRGTADYMIP